MMRSLELKGKPIKKALHESSTTRTYKPFIVMISFFLWFLMAVTYIAHKYLKGVVSKLIWNVFVKMPLFKIYRFLNDLRHE